MDIAIVGMAGRFPGAKNVRLLWDAVRRGVELTRELEDNELRAAGRAATDFADPRFVRRVGALADVDRFDAAFFGYAPREAEVFDPQQRIFLECAWEALEDAGHEPATFDGLIGVYGGAGASTYVLENVYPNRERIEATLGIGQVILALGSSPLATRVSYKLGLRGPSMVTQSACSTSLVAVSLAVADLVSFRCDMALAGGVTVNMHVNRGYFPVEGAAAPDGRCRAFDASASGMVPGNGCALVALRRLEDAVEDGDHVYAIIKGAAVNNDGATKVGFAAPSVEGQAEVISLALALGEISAESIGYVEAHGTGTNLGDPVEVAALTRAFHTARRQYCALGSIKTNVGHLDAAAGVTGLIKAALAVEHGVLPPTVHYEKPNPRIDFASTPFFVSSEEKPWPAELSPRRAGVSSFGVGGTNAHVVLEEPPRREPQRASTDEQLLVLSARTPAALDQATERLATYLDSAGEVSLADVAWTLQRGRRGFEHRRSIVARTSAEAAARLREGPHRSGTASSDVPSVAMMFPGHMGALVGIGSDLYRRESTFRAAIEECAKHLQPLLGLDVLPVLFPEGGPHAAGTRIDVVQASTFAVGWSLASTWSAWGVTPRALVGHSLGEYVAACVAGVWSLKDALAIVVERARLIEAQRPGAMLVVALGTKELAEHLADGCTISGMNAPKQSIVSGPIEAVLDLERRLSAAKIACLRVPSPRAGHSPDMEPVSAPLARFIAERPCAPPRVPFLSNVTGDWITPEQATSPEYWGRQVAAPVRFDAAAARLLERKLALVEVGLGRALVPLVKAHDAAKDAVILSSFPARRTAHEREHLLAALGTLWAAGVKPRFEALHEGRSPRRVPLPTYPFEGVRLWLDPPARTDKASERSPLRMGAWTTAPALPARVGAGRGAWLAVGETPVAASFALPGSTVVNAAPSEVEGLLAGRAAPSRVVDLGLGSPRLLESLAKHLASVPSAELWAVHRDVYAVTGSERAPSRADVTRLEAYAALRRRHPNLKVMEIDVASHESDARVAALVAAEIVAGHGTAERVAHRAGRRWIYGEQPLAPSMPAACGIPHGATFLVNGGLTGVGARVAAHLARRARPRLVVLADHVSVARDERAAMAPSRAVDEAAALALEQRAAVRDRILIERYPSSLSDLCARFVADYLSGGLDFEPGAESTVAAVAARLGVTPRYVGLVEYFLGILAEDGIVSLDREVIRVLRRPEPAEPLAASLAAQPDLRDLVRLLQSCVFQYPKVLRGEVDALEVVYPEGESAAHPLVEAGLRRSGARRWLEVTARTIRELARRAGRPLRVLEVGGGAGYLTFPTLDALAGVEVDYCFTDVSAAVVRTTRQRLEARGARGMRFATLDIDADPIAAGFAPESFDLVVAYNVVHAARDVRQALTNLRVLLAEGGLLLAPEKTSLDRWSGLVGGLLLWQEDREALRRSPLLAHDEWQHVLREAGFAARLPAGAAGEDDADHVLIVAGRPPVREGISPEVAALERLGAEVSVVDRRNPGALGLAIEIARAAGRGIHGVIAADAAPAREELERALGEMPPVAIELQSGVEGLGAVELAVAADARRWACLRVSGDAGAPIEPPSREAWIMEQALSITPPGVLSLGADSPSGNAHEPELGAVRAGRRLRTGFVAPRSDLEKRLAEIVGQLLGVERVGLSDSFFELGGDSLLGMQVATRVRAEFGVALDLRRFLETPTIAIVAEQIERAKSGSGSPAQPAHEPITRASRDQFRVTRLASGELVPATTSAGSRVRQDPEEGR